MPVWFFMFLSMNDFLPGCLFAVVVIKCFMIGVNVWWVYFGTTKHSSCNQCTDTWQKSYFVLYCNGCWCFSTYKLNIKKKRKKKEPSWVASLKKPKSMMSDTPQTLSLSWWRQQWRTTFHPRPQLASWLLPTVWLPERRCVFQCGHVESPSARPSNLELMKSGDHCN